MPSSKPIQTTVEPTSEAPARELAGVRIFATRDGDRVTGRAEFPYATAGGSSSVPIDYRSRRPDQSRDREGAVSGATGGLSTSAPHSTDVASGVNTPRVRAAARGADRLRLARRYLELCEQETVATKRDLADRVAATARFRKCSGASVAAWARKLEQQGEESLDDHYVKTVPKVPTFDPRHAGDAVLICAWWAFRIGRVKPIDTKMVAAAVRVMETGYKCADVLAAIDCYYSYPCDRRAYPFKPFGKWLSYDLDKWLVRAATDADYARAVRDSRKDRGTAAPGGETRVPLLSGSGQPPASSLPPPVSPPETRLRDTRNRFTQSAIRAIACSTAASAVDPSRDREGAAMSDAEKQHRRSAAKTLSAMGAKHAARQEMASTAPGITPLAVKEPETMAEALAQMDPRYRDLLLRSAGRTGDPATRRAMTEASATLPLWWAQVPGIVRDSIDLRLEVSCGKRSIRTNSPQANRSRVHRLRPYLLPDRSGVKSIAAALRLPH